MAGGRPTKIGRALFEMMDELKSRERDLRIKNAIKNFDRDDAYCPFCGVNHLLEDDDCG